MLKKIRPIEVGISDILKEFNPQVTKNEKASLINTYLKFEKSYLHYFNDVKLHLLDRKDHSIPDPLLIKAKNFYKSSMSDSRGKNRDIYNSILSAAPEGFCTYCYQREAVHLDHYLPKGEFPFLNVNTLNLIPSCKECNEEKDQYIPEKEEDQIFHPYRDEEFVFPFLKAKFDSKDFKLNFFITKNGFSDINFLRVGKTFEILALNRRFKIEVIQDLSSLWSNLIELQRNGGGKAVNKFFEIKYNQVISGPLNTWRVALYEELSTNTEFGEIDFEIIKAKKIDLRNF